MLECGIMSVFVCVYGLVVVGKVRFFGFVWKWF